MQLRNATLTASAVLLLALLAAGCAGGSPSVAPSTPAPTPIPTATPVPTLDPGVLEHVRLAIESLDALPATNPHAVGRWALEERDWLAAHLPAKSSAGLRAYQERVKRLVKLLAQGEDDAAFYLTLTIGVAKDETLRP